MTITQLLQQIPDADQRTRALKNLWAERRNDVPRHNTISQALRQAFTWYLAPEGITYWNTVYSNFVFVENVLLW